ncbi:Uncharacterized conserved protein YloU, alkaline shock protein (Asp23) family [Lachnospiraceae bacterium KH1T2]|nr:Uncharacterized conserved protein YloU, alkaline shock protein (Asp23) family [Lachnospiraceae bacterium KH1T2]
MAEEKSAGSVTLEAGIAGEVKIADGVVAVIASLAAREVDGVSMSAGGIGQTLMGYVGMKTADKGVRVDIAESVVSAELAINVKYGFSIPDVSRKVQEKVKSAIETMTGLSVADVNIRVASVDMGTETER